MDSDFDIDEGDEPDSDQEEDAPRRKSRVVTKAYKVETIRSYQTLNQVNLIHLSTFMKITCSCEV